MSLSRHLALIIAALAACTSVAAQTWHPSRLITIVVAYPAGGDTDALARLFADKLSQRLGQQVIVDNRSGASGTIGSAAVAKAAPDGHTLLFAPSTLAIAQHVLKVGPSAPYDVNKDFTPIIKVGTVPLLVVAAPHTGIKELQQVVSAARAGKQQTYGTPGAGSPMHIAGEMLNKAAGVRLGHVPYRGVAPVMSDTIGGHVTIGWVTPASAAQHLQAGTLVPLAVAERQRTPQMPAVRTLIELGFKDVEVSAWMALLGPKGLKPDVVRTLNVLMNEIMKTPDVSVKLAMLGLDPVGGDPAVLARTIAEDDERFGRLVKEFGISVE